MESHNVDREPFDFIEFLKRGLNLLIGREYLEPEEWILNGKIAGGSADRFAYGAKLPQ